MKKSAASGKVSRGPTSERGITSPISRRVVSASKARRRNNDTDAFLRAKPDRPSFTKDDFAEELAEDYLGAATSGESLGAEVRDTVLDEEIGGPFVTSPAKREFAEGFDKSNPEDAEAEPFPSATSQRGEDQEEPEEEEPEDDGT